MAPPSKFRDGSRALYSCARTIKIEHPRFIRLGCSFVRLVQVYYTALRRESVERERFFVRFARRTWTGMMLKYAMR
jgi:hypothetical protein